MNINTNSWHYNVIRESIFSGTPSSNLCSYFWQVVGRLFSAVLLGTVAAFIIATPFIFLTETLGTNLLTSVAGLLGAITWAFAFFIVCVVLVEYLRDLAAKGIRSLGRYDEDGFREPNLVLEYIKAKKEKMCPVITFVDTQEEGIL